MKILIMDNDKSKIKRFFLLMRIFKYLWVYLVCMYYMYFLCYISIYEVLCI